MPSHDYSHRQSILNPEVKRRFELEALEPRILLSGDGLVAVAGSTLHEASGSFQSSSQVVVEQDPSSSCPIFDSQLEYAPSGQPDGIFAGRTGQKTDSATPASHHPAATSATDDSGQELTAQTPATGTEIDT